ncbi:hypothetical protein U1Q18_025028 [Sarracenia purpurea var. burkii]
MERKRKDFRAILVPNEEEPQGPQSHSSVAQVHNPSSPIQQSYVNFSHHQTTQSFVDQHYVINAAGENIWTWDYLDFTETAVSSYRNNNLLPEGNIHDRVGYMTMDELFDLEELVGPMGIGLSSEQILKHLKMGTHISSIDRLSSDEEPEICVICQAEYEDGEKIRTLQCRHYYHAECIMKWLQQKIACPIYKATGLAITS